ncbi:STAS domain-containing protein [Kitasatospora sp. NPDC059648]|uniref:STAS domain-containing protein n=1 Tax=Kitasatospora sp. NPDC059648 TaxID=3346894 RepID=UPI00367542F7
MDEEHVACPAAPGTAPEHPTPRPARRGGRGEPAPSGPVRRADGAVGAAGRPAEGLRVAVERDGPVRIVHVVGDLDRDSADGLRGALARPVADGVERIVLDLRELEFCDSTGFNILLRARADAEAAGLRLELAGLRPVVARLFEVTGADAVLRIHSDLGAALAPPGPVPAAAPDAPSAPEPSSEDVPSARPGVPPGPE